MYISIFTMDFEWQNAKYAFTFYNDSLKRGKKWTWDKRATNSRNKNDV